METKVMKSEDVRKLELDFHLNAQLALAAYTLIEAHPFTNHQETLLLAQSLMHIQKRWVDEVIDMVCEVVD